MIPFPLRARRSRVRSTLLTVGALLILAMPAAAQSPASAVRATPAQFRDLRWLEGTWRGRMSNGKYFYERYERVNDSTIRIIHFPDSTLKTRGQTETISLRGGTIRHGDANAIALDANTVAFARPTQATADFTFKRTGTGWTATLHRADGPATVYQMQRWAAPTAAAPQPTSDRAAVRQAVLDYVEGFYEGDTTKLVRAMWPEVRKYGYYRDAAGNPYRGMAMQFPSGFMNYANGVRAGTTRTPPNAPKEITIFDVQDQTASAKLTAWWGTDYLLLAKENGRWMITHVLWQSPPPR